jgi:putative endonuclease
MDHTVKTYHVYIMASASRVLYIGVTGDLLRRVREHKENRVPGFTARYRVTELVYFEAFGDIRIAIAREKQLKGWLRSRKIALIESVNPHWQDLAAELQSPTPNRGVILSEAKNLSVTVLAVRKTTERFFAPLRMTTSSVVCKTATACGRGTSG